MSDKPKRPAGTWAMLVATHMKAGGKFPKKGTSDYDELKKKLDASKAAKAPASAPAAAAPAAAPKARGRPKKDTGVPMPITDAPIEDVSAVLGVAKKPRTRKITASKVPVTDVDKMDNPAQTAIEAKDKLLHRAKTTTMVAADNLPKVSKGKRAPDLVKAISEKKGMATTIPLARIAGTTGIKIPFTERMLPSVTPL